jgi:hypothetical protein
VEPDEDGVNGVDDSVLTVIKTLAKIQQWTSAD